VSSYQSVRQWKCEYGHTHLTDLERKDDVWCPYCKRAHRDSRMAFMGIKRIANKAMTKRDVEDE
jgi:hypothetical protein